MLCLKIHQNLILQLLKNYPSLYSLLEVVSDLQNLPFYGFLGRFFYGQYFSPTVIESYVSLSTLPVPYGSGTPVYKPLLLE